jgi:hypothetical protein
VKTIRIINVTALLVLLGIVTPVYARQDKPQQEQQKARPAQQQQQARPERQQQAQASRQHRQQQQAQAPRQQRQQQQAQAPRQQRQQQQTQAPRQQRQQQARGQQQQRQRQARFSRPPRRTQQEQDRQRSQPELRLSARGSGRIPDERFHSNFGREHHFRVGEPELVGGYSRFHYGGYWFGFVEPWPVGWYYTDDVYIDYVDGGYYMYDPYYPGARFAISVVL